MTEYAQPTTLANPKHTPYDSSRSVVPSGDFDRPAYHGLPPSRHPQPKVYPHPSASQSTTRPSTFEPKHRMPEYTRKIEWKAFWLQFQTLARYYEWDEEMQLRKVTFNLQGPPLEYLAQLSETVQSNLPLLIDALDKWFGDHILPETYRASLNNVKKQ